LACREAKNRRNSCHRVDAGDRWAADDSLLSRFPSPAASGSSLEPCFGRTGVGDAGELSERVILVLVVLLTLLAVLPDERTVDAAGLAAGLSGPCL
jgi:hypothetical protein